VPYVLSVLDLIPLVCADLYKADRPGWRFQLARWLEKKAIQNASMILAISENTARDVERILSIPAERIRVTPLGVDQSFFSAAAPADPQAFRDRYGVPQDRPVVLYVGGIDQRKNCPMLIDVMKQLKERCLEVRRTAPVLLMAGRIQQDRQFPRLQQRIAEAGLQADVILPGFVPDDDLLCWYALSSAFCFLSLYEGFGLPVLEAMAAGTPVVSNNASCIPEVMGDVGIAVSPDDVNAASEALFRIISDEQLAQSLRAAGKEQARKFTWANTAETTMRAYEELASTLATGGRVVHA
jgi:glycosyltransferase involved in cell wall biosynthesis